MDKKNIVGTIIGALVAGLISFGVQQYFAKPVSFDQAMMTAASEINKNCPMMIDNETQLDNTLALPDNKFMYNYSLINYAIDELDIEELRKNIEPGIINNVRTNPDMKAYRDNEVTMVYSYKDKNQEHLFKIEVSPALYN